MVNEAFEKRKSELRALLEKQGYGFAGEHTAVKICTWTKKSLIDEGTCYKEKFYGIRAHRCCQMAPTVGYCSNRCIFCWREMEYTLGYTMDNLSKLDEPEEIINNSIIQQRKLISGFGGHPRLNKKKFEEAQEPMHFAISLTGEPTTYPKLNELIRLLHQRGKTTFVVSNGQLPDRIKNIEPPTQLYISVDAPNRDLFYKVDRPVFKDGWERLIASLVALRELKNKTRTTLRMTLIKGINMVDPEGWAEAIKIADPLFVEVKAYMFVGSSRKRLSIENMPRHQEVKEFALKIAKASGYKYIDEKEESRVVLLMKEDFPGRIMKWND